MTDPALQRLLDESELRGLAATYMRGLDRLDPALVRSVFAEDATTHYGAFRGGADEMPDMAMTALSAYRATQHVLGQINLDIDGDTATGEVYFQAFHQHATEDFDRFICGRYIDRYARRDGTLAHHAPHRGRRLDADRAHRRGVLRQATAHRARHARSFRPELPTARGIGRSVDIDRFQSFLDVVEPERGATVLSADPIPGGYSRDTVRAESSSGPTGPASPSCSAATRPRT